MIYKVIGLMSGSSLDGLDIVHVQLEEVRGQWSFQILHSDCIPYNDKWSYDLQRAIVVNVSDFLKLHTSYGRYLGEQVNEFIARHNIDHQVHFIASHGHTVFHEPHNNTTCQIGDGAALAAATGLPVISDLRSMDVALGGQGAPIVPVGDKMLFNDYDYLLNIGGIANITVQRGDQPSLAFDVCPANQILNELAAREGKAMDEGGQLAAQGTVLLDVIEELAAMPYYQLPAPKSLSNEDARELVFPTLLRSDNTNHDRLHTATKHIVMQIAAAIKQYPHSKEQAKLLATGGGAFNTFLIKELEKTLTPLNVFVVVPDAKVVKFKEALVMAFMGVLRWREEVNVFSSVTGASKDSVGGALWMGGL